MCVPVLCKFREMYIAYFVKFGHQLKIRRTGAICVIGVLCVVLIYKCSFRTVSNDRHNTRFAKDDSIKGYSIH
jgi:hypothetical protein